MILCLSARMFATPGNRNQFDLDMAAFIQFAKSCGYGGITLRPGQIDPDTPAEEVARIKSLMTQHSAPCSFIKTGAIRDSESYDAHSRLLDHAVFLECPSIQPQVGRDADVTWLQKFCDLAAERSVQVAPQLHNNTGHDTVPNCLALFKKVNRKNFGINFEASHLLLQGEKMQNGEAVRALGDRIFSVCVQNYKIVDGAPKPCLPGDPLGVDFESVFGALKDIGFNGFVTHISGAYPDIDNRAVCKAYVDYLRPVMA